MLSRSLLIVLLSILGNTVKNVDSLSTLTTRKQVQMETSNGSMTVDRREALQKTSLVGASAATAFLSNVAFADDTDLSSFQEGPRGIKYSILKEGSGEKPVRAQKVYAKYTLWTGGFGEKQVDSNTGFLGKPLGVVAGVGQVIKGWDLVLLDMQVGEIRRIIVPSDLGYGDKGAGGSIPPKATLYFEMEITDMDPAIILNDQQKTWIEDNPL